MELFKRKKKWIFTTPWVDTDWAQRDYDALNRDPELNVVEYGSAPIIVDGEQVGYSVLFWIESTEDKYQRFKETLKETHTEEFYMGVPLLKHALNVERTMPA